MLGASKASIFCLSMMGAALVPGPVGLSYFGGNLGVDARRQHKKVGAKNRDAYVNVQPESGSFVQKAQYIYRPGHKDALDEEQSFPVSTTLKIRLPEKMRQFPFIRYKPGSDEKCDRTDEMSNKKMKRKLCNLAIAAFARKLGKKIDPLPRFGITLANKDCYVQEDVANIRMLGARVLKGMYGSAESDGAAKGVLCLAKKPLFGSVWGNFSGGINRLEREGTKKMNKMKNKWGQEQNKWGRYFQNRWRYLKNPDEEEDEKDEDDQDAAKGVVDEEEEDLEGKKRIELRKSLAKKWKTEALLFKPGEETCGDDKRMSNARQCSSAMEYFGKAMDIEIKWGGSMGIGIEKRNCFVSRPGLGAGGIEYVGAWKYASYDDQEEMTVGILCKELQMTIR